MDPWATIVDPFPTTADQQRFLLSEATLKDWLGRRRASKNHPGLNHVDTLLSGRPEELEVPISGLPDQIEELFSIYKGLFQLRDYRVTTVDRSLDDLWIARLERARS